MSLGSSRFKVSDMPMSAIIKLHFGAMRKAAGDSRKLPGVVSAKMSADIFKISGTELVLDPKTGKYTEAFLDGRVSSEQLIQARGSNPGISTQMLPENFKPSILDVKDMTVREFFKMLVDYQKGILAQLNKK